MMELVYMLLGGVLAAASAHVGWSLMSRWLSRANTDHDWIGWTPVFEPGISDIDGGRWSRVDVECTRCGETRRVWKSTDRTLLSQVTKCVAGRVDK